MQITLHCGGMPFNGETAKTESLGGSETAAYYLAKGLAEAGHKVTMFTRHQQEGIWDGVRYIYAGEETEDQPFGTRFHFYAENTPCDVLVMQRHPRAFRYRWAAKLHFWWLHDLALRRNLPEVRAQLWNVDGILTVSEWHREQVMEVYGISGSNVFVVPNGVDLSMVDRAPDPEVTSLVADEDVNLLYASRPERGLEHLVREGGIMERLIEARPEARLYVSMYDNVAPQMRGYYEALWRRCEELPNVVNLGVLTRDELFDLMRGGIDALAYPSEFEETSCLLAKECMAAGVPVLGSSVGALPETLRGAGSFLFPLKEGQADEDAFVRLISNMDPNGEDWEGLRSKQTIAAQGHGWEKTARGFEVAAETTFDRYTANSATVARELMYTSDIFALQHYLERLGDSAVAENPLLAQTWTELQNLYWFRHGRYREHYADYYDHERAKGVEHSGFELEETGRLRHLSRLLEGLPTGTWVVDYGCAHGATTLPLAKDHPHLRFFGLDIDERNVQEAWELAHLHGITNAEFSVGDVHEDWEYHLDRLRGRVGVVVAAEVLEHVKDPAYLVDRLAPLLHEEGRFVLTTPHGPWEATGYRAEHPWRAHVHHLERADLHDLFGHHPGFQVQALPETHWRDRALGHYVTQFWKPEEASGQVDYDRKISQLAPRQTVSACLLVGGQANTLRRCLDHTRELADEIVVGIDRKTISESALSALQQFRVECEGSLWPIVRFLDVSSPIEAGFDASRNAVIAEAYGDWIFWPDSDEWLNRIEEVHKYLRLNCWNGYALQQHHLSAEPAGIIKTDMPVKLFRNRRGIRFYGLVHEHPEKALNHGVGAVNVLPDAQVMHEGYENEDVRRSRFRRNLDLLARDRETYPDRLLGKFLWLRDLTQMNQYELEATEGRITSEILSRIDEGLALWEDLLDSADARTVRDAVQFYSTLARMRGGGFWSSVHFKTSDQEEDVGGEPTSIYFASADHARRLMKKLLEDEVTKHEQAYR